MIKILETLVQVKSYIKICSLYFVCQNLIFKSYKFKKYKYEVKFNVFFIFFIIHWAKDISIPQTMHAFNYKLRWRQGCQFAYCKRLWACFLLSCLQILKSQVAFFCVCFKMQYLMRCFKMFVFNEVCVCYKQEQAWCINIL